MKQRFATHSTFVIERNYPTTPQRVFAAFSDPAKKRRWFAEGEHFEVDSFEIDFRVGGTERACFRLKDGQPCRNDSVYQDILTDRRIAIAYTMTLGEIRFSASLATFEFVAAEKGTDLIFTEQAAFFEGADGPQIREQGWRELLDRLAQELVR